MDLQLNEIGATFAVGMYAILGLGAVLLVLLPKELPANFASARESKLPVALAGAILAFTMGIFLERLSNFIGDEFPADGLIVRRDKDIRADVFYSKFADDYAEQDAHIDEVWGTKASAMKAQIHEAAQIQERSRRENMDSDEASRRMREWINAERSGVASEIYFEAKSAVVTQENYFTDLLLTQTHIRFVRSIAVTSFLFAGMALVFCGVRLALRERWTVPVKVRAYVRDCVGILLFFAVMWGATRTSYGLEEGHYDDRVFGYYLHMIRGK